MVSKAILLLGIFLIPMVLGQTTADHCADLDENQNPAVCRSCETGFQLNRVSTGDGIQSICIPISGLIPHCLTYIVQDTYFICLTCNDAAGYRLANTFTSTNSHMTQCILAQDLIQNCDTYQRFLTTCSYRCLACTSDLRLGNLKTGSKVRQVCLDYQTEYIPDCTLYIKDAGSYYCKAGHCDSPSSVVHIGSSDLQLACTRLVWNGDASLCSIYERPTPNDESLQCRVCLNADVSTSDCISPVPEPQVY